MSAPGPVLGPETPPWRAHRPVRRTAAETIQAAETNKAGEGALQTSWSREEQKVTEQTGQGRFSWKKQLVTRRDLRWLLVWSLGHQVLESLAL